jgi:serine phosphatase RsbU (regulator of sigma subunit)/TPR repeat protein
MRTALIPLGVLLFASSAFAQQTNLDSLLGVWNDRTRPDSSRVSAYSDYIWSGFLFTDPDSAIELAEALHRFAAARRSVDASEQAHNIQGIANSVMGDYPKALRHFNQYYRSSVRRSDTSDISTALGNLGLVYKEMGLYDSAIICFDKAIIIDEARADSLNQGRQLNSIAQVLLSSGNYPKALDYFLTSLGILESLGEDQLIAASLNNIAMVYDEQQDYPNALQYYRKALPLGRRTGDDVYVSNVLLNMGNVFISLGADSMAIDHIEQALVIKERMGDRQGVARCLQALGKVELSRKDFRLALSYNIRAHALFEEMGDKVGTVGALINMGGIEVELKRADKAITACQLGLKIAEDLSLLPKSVEACQCLYEAFKLQGDMSNALRFHEKMMSYRDSIYNDENTKTITRLGMQYEFDKKEAATRAEQEKKDAVAAEQLKRKNQQRNAFIGGFALMLGLAGVSYRSYRIKKRDNAIITAQKEKVEQQNSVITEQKVRVEKQNEAILASLEYAKKLQQAVLPPAKVVKEFFADSFLLYLPRDIVSGDFYWMESFSLSSGGGQGEVVSLFAVGDCTGHGVPGAMLSVMGLNGLNRALNELHITQPADFLTQLTKDLHDAFLRSDTMVRDGMDMSICALDMANRKLTFAGANNPLWIARNGEMLIFKPNKRPVGHHDMEGEGFSQITIDLQPGDTIYLMTDGYQDQLGGPKGLKMMTKVFRTRLTELSTLPLQEQRTTLISELETWRGDQHQTDDVCVMGVRV